MPPLPPVSFALHFRLLYVDFGNTNVQNNLYFTYSQTMSNTDLTTLCNSMVTRWTNHIGPQVSQNLTLFGVVANDLTTSTAAQGASTVPSIGGALAGPELSNAAAFVISNETARRYRGGHSRVYLPGQMQSHLADGNTWTTAFQTAMLQAWNAFISEFITTAVPAAVGTLRQIVVHRYGRTSTSPVSTVDDDSPSVPLTNPYFDLVTASAANPNVGSQRRRNQQLV